VITARRLTPERRFTHMPGDRRQLQAGNAFDLAKELVQLILQNRRHAAFVTIKLH
jgi:hypothetical protein